MGNVLLPLEVMLPPGDTNSQHTPAPSHPAQIHPVTPKLMKRARWRQEIHIVKSGIGFWFEGLPRSSNFDDYLEVSIGACASEERKIHVFLPVVSVLSSRYGLAARTTVPFTLSQIKLLWKGEDRANLRLIEVEREPGRLPAPISAPSRSKNRTESAGSSGVEAPQPAGNPRLC